VIHLVQLRQIAPAANPSAAPVAALSELAVSVRDRAPIRFRTTRGLRVIDGCFHALMLPRRCPKSQYLAKFMHTTLINNVFDL
jgi:hypothetical protein